MEVDFSKVSIEKALQNKFKNADFQVADLHYYTPAQDFDTIVFNEAFYYINTNVKAKVVNRILSKLKKDGYFNHLHFWRRYRMLGVF